MIFDIRKLYTPAYTITPKVLHYSHLPLAQELSTQSRRAEGCQHCSHSVLSGQMQALVLMQDMLLVQIVPQPRSLGKVWLSSHVWVPFTACSCSPVRSMSLTESTYWPGAQPWHTSWKLLAAIRHPWCLRRGVSAGLLARGLCMYKPAIPMLLQHTYAPLVLASHRQA